jgi:hypothetical protein
VVQLALEREPPEPPTTLGVGIDADDDFDDDLDEYEVADEEPGDFEGGLLLWLGPLGRWQGRVRGAAGGQSWVAGEGAGDEEAPSGWEGARLLWLGWRAADGLRGWGRRGRRWAASEQRSLGLEGAEWTAGCSAGCAHARAQAPQVWSFQRP